MARGVTCRGSGASFERDQFPAERFVLGPAEVTKLKSGLRRIRLHSPAESTHAEDLACRNSALLRRIERSRCTGNVGWDRPASALKFSLR